MARSVLVVASVGLALLSLGAGSSFDPKPWIEDLNQVRETLATKYANLEWAVFDHEVDLGRLFADTKARVEMATSDADARAAFDRFARKLGDGHVVFDWPHAGHPAAQAGPAPDQCSALGYDAIMRADPVAANVPGYQALSTPQSSDFPAGIITLNRQSVGVVQIGVFTPQGFPMLCEAALKELSVSLHEPCNDTCSDRVELWAAGQLTLELAAQLHALKQSGATLLVVDIAANGGGSEWSEAVARMVTPRRLRSEAVGFVRGEHWAKSLSEDETSLRQFAEHETGNDRAMLLRLADQAEVMRKVARAPCDSAPLWRREHLACNWLGTGLYASGFLASADPSLLRGKPWATLVFEPMKFPYDEGVWRGPLIVLVDRNTGSAAAQFAALLRDNRAAIIMGEPAAGGCGHTNGGTPTRLRNSGATLEVPDCARFRVDGSNEMVSVQPDVLIGFTAVDGPHCRGARFLAKLPEAVNRAEALRN